MATDPEILITPVTSPADLHAAFDGLCASFGVQARDGIFAQSNPGWDTPEGRRAGAQRLVDRWAADTADGKLDVFGNPTTIFLKAVVPSSPSSTEAGAEAEAEAEGNPQGGAIAGLAIFVQHSFVPGHGVPPLESSLHDDDAATVARNTATLGLDALHPGPSGEPERRYTLQLFASLQRRRAQVAREKEAEFNNSNSNKTNSPTPDMPPAAAAIFHLDLCSVHPDYQRRGIATRLVRWGLDEARRRGGLECTTEASSMGRAPYQRLGFRPEGDGADLVYEVDDEFRSRDRPPNLFLRTGPTTAVSQ